MKRKPDISKLTNRIADYVELAISFLLIAAVLLLLINLILEFGMLPFFDEAFDFNAFLAKAFNLIIGIEFTRMLCRHTPDTIIEVLLFATARQLIIAHPGAVESFLSILSIAILFILRKYLLPESPPREGGSLLWSLLQNRRQPDRSADTPDRSN